MGLTYCDWLFWSVWVMVWLVLVWYIIFIVLTTYLVAFFTLNKINNFCFLGFERPIHVYLELCQLPTWTRIVFSRLLFLLRIHFKSLSLRPCLRFVNLWDLIRSLAIKLLSRIINVFGVAWVIESLVFKNLLRDDWLIKVLIVFDFTSRLVLLACVWALW